MLDANGVEISALIGKKLSFEAFNQLSGTMATVPFVKIVVEVESRQIHFLDDHKFKLHAKYIAKKILHISEDELLSSIDQLNKKFYFGNKRELYLGILALYEREGEKFFTLETVEVDDMSAQMLTEFYNVVKENITAKYSLFLKPANHGQELAISDIAPTVIPRIFGHELMEAKSFIPLNTGVAKGRLAVFESSEDYQRRKEELKWHDIIVMKRVPDNIPRISGIINAQHTTPLSHTNVLAYGWQIPNAIQIGVIEDIKSRGLDGKWVSYTVDRNNTAVTLEEIKYIAPPKPSWTTHQIKLETPEIEQAHIVGIEHLRMDDRKSYGTKSANLGEINHLLQHPCTKLLGFYKVKRFPRNNLLDYLAQRLGVSQSADLVKECGKFLNKTIKVPQGICIPFSLQQQFLESSPQIQQTIGKIKMALELNAKEVDPLCIKLQQMIRNKPLSSNMKDLIDEQIIEHMSGVESFVVRSSSNAEDLEHFSAAGIYESYNHVTNTLNIFSSIKKVWASLVSPRSMRLRHEVGISLEDSFMGVVIQEEIKCHMGGVLVTTNPMNPQEDFRNVYINVSTKSVTDVVQGTDRPFQMLFNVIEGGGSTLIKDKLAPDLSKKDKAILQKLAIAGKLLQSHFSPDYTYKTPVDIEWAVSGEQIYILQIRPYAI